MDNKQFYIKQIIKTINDIVNSKSEYEINILNRLINRYLEEIHKENK